MNEIYCRKMTNQKLKKYLKNSQMYLSIQIQSLQQYLFAEKVRSPKVASQKCRQLALKAYGTNYQVINDQGLFAYSNNLKALSLVIAEIIFKDAYITSLFIEELNHIKNNMRKISNFPLQSFCNPKQYQIIFAQILNSLCQIGDQNPNRSIRNILRNNQLRLQIFTLILRSLLIKLGYKNAQNYQSRRVWADTGQIFALICQYWDINLISKRSYISKSSKGFPQIYYFPDYGLFILTPDNKQFICGKYYESEKEFSQKNIYHPQPYICKKQPIKSFGVYYPIKEQSEYLQTSVQRKTSHSICNKCDIKQYLSTSNNADSLLVQNNQQHQKSKQLNEQNLESYDLQDFIVEKTEKRRLSSQNYGSNKSQHTLSNQVEQINIFSPIQQLKDLTIKNSHQEQFLRKSPQLTTREILKEMSYFDKGQTKQQGLHAELSQKSNNANMKNKIQYNQRKFKNSIQTNFSSQKFSTQNKYHTAEYWKRHIVESPQKISQTNTKGCNFRSLSPKVFENDAKKTYKTPICSPRSLKGVSKDQQTQKTLQSQYNKAAGLEFLRLLYSSDQLQNEYQTPTKKEAPKFLRNKQKPSKFETNTNSKYVSYKNSKVTESKSNRNETKCQYIKNSQSMKVLTPNPSLNQQKISSFLENSINSGKNQFYTPISQSLIKLNIYKKSSYGQQQSHPKINYFRENQNKHKQTAIRSNDNQYMKRYLQILQENKQMIKPINLSDSKKNKFRKSKVGVKKQIELPLKNLLTKPLKFINSQ